MLKKILSQFRFRNNREFYSISESDQIHIFNEFNSMNKILCTGGLILNYIKNYDLKYYNYIIKKNNKNFIESNNKIIIKKNNKIFIESNKNSSDELINYSFCKKRSIILGLFYLCTN